MKTRGKWLAVIALSLVVTTATLVPYWLAHRLARPAVFGGFLLNPVDGFSYLAKMRQGMQGSWLFNLPYTPEPGKGAFVFVYYLLLGHIGRWFGASLLGVYQVARCLAAAGMFILGFLFFDRALPAGRSRWMAFLLTLIGSGLGWLAIPFGIQASDLMIPESVPFLTAYINAHFPLATIGLLGGLLSVSAGGRLKMRMSVAFFCGVLLGAVLPFSVISLVVILAIWLGWEILRDGWGDGFASTWRAHRARLLPYLALLGGVGPWSIYYLWLARRHPSLAAWTVQNVTPSPPPLHYVLGYGLVLLLAIVGIFLARPHRQPYGRLLIAWMVSNAFLLYAPFSLQRRLSLGLYFPIAGLAALGLDRLAMSKGRYRIALVAVLILSIPSNIIVVGAGLSEVRNQESMMVHSVAEIDAYAWIAEHVPANSLILAAPETGNRLPAFASVRVLYGHPFETPNADAQRALVESLFAWKSSVEKARSLLMEQAVDFVYYGERERELGEPVWLADLTQVYRNDGIEIYEATWP